MASRLIVVTTLELRWFIDEVTSVAGWTTALKFLRDNRLFGLDLVVCTGSSWTDEAEVGRDLLAGRAGATNVRRRRLLLPMSFGTSCR